jgi:hypothetical protein
MLARKGALSKLGGYEVQARGKGPSYQGEEVMESISRRNMLAATAAGNLLTASVPAAQTVDGIPQPRRPGHGGTDPGPRNLMRDGQNPDMFVPRSTDHGS